MTSLTDIARVSERVKVPVLEGANGSARIGEGEIEVYGISVQTIAQLIADFPQIRRLFDPQQPGGALPDDLFARLIRTAPQAVHQILAAGCGQPGDATAEAEAATLPLEVQMELFEAIARLTMPQGFGPFVEKLSRLIRVFNPNLDLNAAAAGAGITAPPSI
jgi:hypothetical protein